MNGTYFWIVLVLGFRFYQLAGVLASCIFSAGFLLVITSLFMFNQMAPVIDLVCDISKLQPVVVRYPEFRRIPKSQG